MSPVVSAALPYDVYKEESTRTLKVIPRESATRKEVMARAKQTVCDLNQRLSEAVSRLQEGDLDLEDF